MRNVFIVVLLAGIFTCTKLFEQRTSLSMNALIFKNIEALSQGIEDDDTPYECLGSGDLDCPDGTKVKRIYRGYNLKH